MAANINTEHADRQESDATDPGTDRVQECTICQWQQSHGRGETVISCPRCGSTSFNGVSVR